MTRITATIIALSLFIQAEGRNRLRKASGTADAVTFLNVAGVSDNTQRFAASYLSRRMRYIKAWDSVVAIYPFVGGTATAHMYNMKDPRNVDAAYRIAWGGIITHSNTGVLSNGTTGTGNTFYNPATVGISNMGMAYCSRTATSNAGQAMGSLVSTNSRTGMAIRSAGSFFSYQHNNTSQATGLNATSDGYYSDNRTSGTMHFFSKNGVILSTNTNATIGTLPNLNMYILSINNTGNASNFSAMECTYADIGWGISHYTDSIKAIIVNRYNAILGR
jgi:hypothetical protein